MINSYTGTIKKMISFHEDTVRYTLPLGEHLVPMNDLVGKTLTINYYGRIFCMDSGKKIKKSFGQGYSWEAFSTLAQCDMCIMKPELCHYKAGTCRDPKWGENFCLKPHIIYISLTSGLKVGITRQTQIPIRWVDQGAVKAIRLCQVPDRLTSGLIEIEIAKVIGDKTNWRNMLKNVYKNADLLKVKKSIISDFKVLLDKYQAEILDDKVFEFNYPVDMYPTKVSSLNLDKNAIIESKLLGIKGQYLIFESGVINMRKYQGYEVTLQW